jgi:hypothetical protein
VGRWGVAEILTYIICMYNFGGGEDLTLDTRFGGRLSTLSGQPENSSQAAGKPAIS